ncbi:hypothetical protein KY289_033228 [Solanum tuberosum]|nr:hypothetical protein KY289_033228 [Solanum tuberosum]
MEPFQSPLELDQYKRKLGFANVGVNCLGKIWFFWREDWEGDIILDMVQQVTLKFNMNNQEFLISTVYARCNALDRLELWEELGTFGDMDQCPWIIGGDFNVILNEEEKSGGLQFTQTEALDFAAFISNSALTEVRFSGSKYTWWNGRIEEGCIFKRLDKILVNQSWTYSHHQKSNILSDKGPIMLHCI